MNSKDWTIYALPASRAVGKVAAVSGAFYRDASRRFTEQNGALLRDTTTGTRRVWETWKSSPPDWRVDWDRAVGALTTDQIGDAEAPRRWIEFLLHLSNRGVQGDWKAHFATPLTVTYCGGVLRDLRRISVRTQGRRAPQIELHSDSPQPFEPRPSFMWRRQRISVYASADFAHPHEKTVDNSMDESFTDAVWANRWNNLTDAIWALDFFASHYGAWVRRVLRVVVPLISPDGVTASSSDATAPGVIRLSLDHDPVLLGELLVHESAHLYFHLFEHRGPIVNGADSNLYWSPFRRTERPIRNILLAYHAFANVVLYYRSLQSMRGINSAAIRALREPIEQQLAQIEEPLKCSPGLTPRGRFLWSTLHQELHA